MGRNAFTNVLTFFIADPVDAVTGSYIIQTTDFILASIPEALKLERLYRSTNRDASCLGKGWIFPYGSRIYRDGKKPGRLHMDAITGHSLLFEKGGYIPRSLLRIKPIPSKARLGRSNLQQAAGYFIKEIING